ncbi:hypothetical protein BG015_011171 [Linnemannia schmuckeri]|uniref:DUF1746 domain-containing protein n=1 Tax=Linnemannia schmuckeri TaxID=64567 RepID=A0A9P5V824_9FUNG|nr:hypothetical protein BG015_011171 [Linnemannia schmuckeri]
MSNLYFKKDVHKSIESLLYGLYVYEYLLDTSTFGLLIRCLVQEVSSLSLRKSLGIQQQLISIKSKAPTLRVALYAVVAAAFLAFLRHLRPPERYAVIIDFVGNASTPSQSIIYWLDIVILLLQVTEAFLVFKIIKSEEIPRRSTLPPNTTIAPARANSPSSDREQGRLARSRTETSGESGSGSNRAMPVLVDQSSVAASSTSNSQPPEYTPRRANNNSNSQHSEDLDDMYPEYYEDEEEVRFSTDLDRQRHQQQQQTQLSHGGSQSQRSRSSVTAARGRNGSSNNTNRRGRSDTDGSDDESSEGDDEDPLGDDYEEVLEQETFVFQLRFQDLMSYIFSSQEALTMPDPRTLTGAAVANGGQSGSSSAQQRELPV